MTAPDLTAIVESVARAEYERARAGVDSDHPMHDEPWESLNGYVQYAWREEVLDLVRATLTALMPLADGWEDIARQNDDLGMRRVERDEPEYAQRAFGSRDAQKSCAKELRGIIS